MDNKDIYYHPSYNALVEHHMRACDSREMHPDASPLCKYLTHRLSATNWMIQENEEGNYILRYIETSLKEQPSGLR